MANDAERILTEGLLAGYAGNSKKETINRGGIQGKALHHATPDGAIYHDEYFARRLGGGQEIIQIGYEKFTRLYAGGIIDQESLKTLGATEAQIITFLKQKIKELGGRTRLFEDCGSPLKEDWKYDYYIESTEPEIELTMGVERIYYKAKLVFKHIFILCPIK